MTQKLSTDDFIKKSVEKYGHTFDYSKTIYITSKYKVEIICRKHGSFWQTPNNHLKYNGCKKCEKEIMSEKLKLQLNIFIERSNQIHNNKFYYSLVEYSSIMKKVKIICPIHGVFEQVANEHMNGKGCRKCANLAPLTRDEYLEKFQQVHGDRYDYSKFEYHGATIKSVFICKIHGEFTQLPYSHLACTGCPKCKSSHGENKIRNFLTNNNVEFVEQKRFSDCRNIKPLPFDFYIEKYNIVIEFDGPQHYNEPSNHRYKKFDFEKIKKHDQIKNKWCEENNIKLIRIKYTENIDSILKNLI